MNDEPVHTIPGYQLLSHLGQGGMADVYLAIQQCFGRKVAIKILPSTNDEEETRQRFLQEAKIVGQLSHSNIIGVHDVGEITGSYYIAMDFLPGKNLKDLIREDLKPKAAIHIIIQVAKALDFAHRKGFIHRDVKPDNVLFREDGSAVLTDFGIASDTRSDKSLTQTGLVYGTPNYMSPEQSLGKVIDSRADIYSLGVMFFYMLTHRLPYRGSDPIDLAMKHLKDPLPIMPLELGSLQAVMDNLLAKEPADRYQHVYEFLDDLAELSDWEIEELDAFDANEHYSYETFHEGSDDENEDGATFLESDDTDRTKAQEAHVQEHSTPFTNHQSKSSNPFSQRDFSGFLIKTLLFLSVVFVLILIFMPELLLSVPGFEEYKTMLENLITDSASPQ